MMSSLKTWFEALSSREKTLISILLILLAGTIAFYAIAKPFSSAMTDAQIRYQEAVERHARIGSKVALFVPSDGNKTTVAAQIKPVSGSIDSFVSQSAGEAGFAIGKIDPQTDGSVTMTVDSAKPTALFRWLSILEQRGIRVMAISANPGQNDTISATIKLRRANIRP